MSYYQSWQTVKNSVNTLLVSAYHRRGVTNIPDDIVRDVYLDSLPRAIDDTLAFCFVENLNREAPTVQIVLRAYEQLEKEGRIGSY